MVFVLGGTAALAEITLNEEKIVTVLTMELCLKDCTELRSFFKDQYVEHGELKIGRAHV